MQSYSLLLYDLSVCGHELSIVGVAAGDVEEEVGLSVTVDEAATVTSLEVLTGNMFEELISVAVEDITALS